MAMLLLNMNMFTHSPSPRRLPLPDRIRPNDLSPGLVDPKLAEADPEKLPSSATFIEKTVSSIDIAFLYMYMLTVPPPIGEGVHVHDQASVVSASLPAPAILSSLSVDEPSSLPIFIVNLVPVIDI